MGEGWGLGHAIRSHAALFHSPETPLRSLGSIVHALIIRVTDPLLHRYLDDGAARAADREIPQIHLMALR